MELVRGGSLHSLIQARKREKRPFSQSESATIMRSLLDAVSYIHQKGIVHRDLKPENILIDDWDNFSTVKLADFGLSAQINFSSEQGSSLYTNCGTLLFKGPEIITKKVYSKPVDIWSCGIIMYILLSGKHPFFTGKETREELESRILSPEWTFEPEKFDKNAKDLLLKLVMTTPSKRYTASQAMRHPWITQMENSTIPLTTPEIYQLIRSHKKMKNGLQLLMILEGIVDHYKRAFSESNAKKQKSKRNWGNEASEDEELGANQKEEENKGEIAENEENKSHKDSHRSDHNSFQDTKFNTISDFSHLIQKIESKPLNQRAIQLRNTSSGRNSSREKDTSREKQQQNLLKRPTLITPKTTNRSHLNLNKEYLKSNKHHKAGVRHGEALKQTSLKGLNELGSASHALKNQSSLIFQKSYDANQVSVNEIPSPYRVDKDSGPENRQTSSIRIKKLTKPPIPSYPHPPASKTQPQSSQEKLHIFKMSPINLQTSRERTTGSPLESRRESRKKQTRTLNSVSTVMTEKDKESLCIAKLNTSCVIANHSKSLSSKKNQGSSQSPNKLSVFLHENHRISSFSPVQKHSPPNWSKEGHKAINLRETNQPTEEKPKKANLRVSGSSRFISKDKEDFSRLLKPPKASSNEPRIPHSKPVNSLKHEVLTGLGIMKHENNGKFSKKSPLILKRTKGLNS